MRRRSTVAVVSLLAAGIAVGAASSPAQAAVLPGPALFGMSSAGWTELTSANASDIPGGVAGLCMLGSVCSTRFLAQQTGDEVTGQLFESAGTAKSVRDAARRLGATRAYDSARFAEIGVPLKWSKVKTAKDAKMKGTAAWQAQAVTTGVVIRLGAVQYKKRIAYFAATVDVSTSKAKFLRPIARVLKSKQSLSALSGDVKGYYGAVTLAK